MPSSDEEQEDKTDPKMLAHTSSSLKAGVDPTSGILRDAIEHMKSQNAQQVVTNRHLRYTNELTRKGNRLLLVGCALGFLMLCAIVFQQVQYADSLGEIRALSRKYSELDAKMSEKLSVTPADIKSDVGDLTDKLRQDAAEAPKIVADDNGRIKVELPVSSDKQGGSGRPRRAVVTLPKSPDVELLK